MVVRTKPEKATGRVVVYRDHAGALEGPVKVTGAPEPSLFGVMLPVESLGGEAGSLLLDDVRGMWELTGSDLGVVQDYRDNPGALVKIAHWYEDVCR